MEKFSVKKPFTVLVSVILVIILGVVSLTNIQTDLLPSISLPYMVVITTYPGASPERIETDVTEPMERSLGTISHVKNVYSMTSENYTYTELEFEDGTDMDSAMVKVSSAVQQTAASLPSGCGTPSIMEISMSMVATMYTAVSRDGYDRYDLSDWAEDEVVPYLERQDGVASVSTSGLVEKTVQVDLNAEKIDDLNDKILALTNENLADAKEQLDTAKAQLAEGQEQLEKQESQFGETVAGALFDQIDAGSLVKELQGGIDSLTERLDDLSSQTGSLDLGTGAAGDVSGAIDDFEDAYRTASDKAARLAEQAEKAGSDVTGTAEAAAAAARQAYAKAAGENLIAGAMRNITDAISSAITETGAGIDALTDERITAIADDAAQVVQNALEDTDTENADAIVGAVKDAVANSLSAARDAAKSLADSAAEAQKEASEAASSAAQSAQNALNTASAAQAAGTILTGEETAERIDNAVKELAEAREALDGSTISSLSSGIAKVMSAAAKVQSLLDLIARFDTQGAMTNVTGQVKTALSNLTAQAARLPEYLDLAETGVSSLLQGQLDAAVGFSEAARQLGEAQTQLASAQNQFDTARETALASANADSLVTASTLSQVIYAQNFSMPAGYIDDENDNSWLLRVGDEYDSDNEIADSLLADIDGIGTIRLADVADITVIDNADLSYAKVNGKEGVVLAIFKSSTAGTNAVSESCRQAIRELEEETDGVHFTTLMDQGEYIDQIVGDILSSMMLGALLAILILALFLRDIRPTLMVGISIPLSVMFAIVLMYFSNLSMNIMTLGGLSLGIGMLVDNSIVVMENVIRLRQRGTSAAGAAVQGAKQVSGAIVSSTLTTICVFLPMIFSTGTVRELLIPMALSITYCLVASLVVALTVIPSSASFILKKVKPKKKGTFDKILDHYGKRLRWCLEHKAIPLAVTIGLLAFSVIVLVRMGIVLLPEMTSNNIEMTIVTDEDLTREESHAEADKIMAAVLENDAVSEAGAMDSAGTLSLVSSLGGSADTYGNYICYINLPEGTSTNKIKQVTEELKKATQGFRAEVTVSNGGMSDMTSLMGSGLTVNVYGTDTDEMTRVSEQVMEEVRAVRGFENVSNGTENDEKTLHLVIDRDKAMKCGLTTAQIYTQIASRLTTSVTSTSITMDGRTIDVVVKDDTDPLTKENLLDMEVEGTSLASAASGTSLGTSSGAGSSLGTGMGASGLSSSMSSGADVSSGMGTSLGAGTDTSSNSLLSALSGDSTSLPSEEGGSGENESSAAEESGSGESVSSSAGESGSEKGTSSTAGEDSANESTEGTSDDNVHTLREFATIEETTSPANLNRQNSKYYMTVTADTADGYNTTLLSRNLRTSLEKLNETLPEGYSVEIAGETTQVREMVMQMVKMMALALVFIYFVMVAQFQSLLSPFIIMFTIPLAFTGGMLGLIIGRQQISIMSLMGFLVLMGTVVNNGIVFVDYANQLRTGGMERRDALIATGKTRMRPILMTTLTTVLAMAQLIFGGGMGAQIARGMAIVIAAGLIYSTFMTLFIVPVMYDIFYKRQPLAVEIPDDVDEMPDDAAEFIEEMRAEKEDKNGQLP